MAVAVAGAAVACGEPHTMIAGWRGLTCAAVEAEAGFMCAMRELISCSAGAGKTGAHVCSRCIIERRSS